MNTELEFLTYTALLTGLLWIPVVIGYVKSRGLLTPEDYVSAPTSTLPDWVNRANRAHLNAVENFAPFAAIVIIAQFTGYSSSLTAYCAMTYFFARVGHAVIHLAGFKYFMARTIAFNIAWLAFMVYAVALLINI